MVQFSEETKVSHLHRFCKHLETYTDTDSIFCLFHDQANILRPASGYLPLIVYLGYSYSEPKPSLFKLFSPWLKSDRRTFRMMD
ncbi:TOM complex component Tom7 [Penicillium waksmanii]|uniref:TOM complex component Tom7 n=1 Tax=Penicillium waksmanii TaxID=69791 RepID=UPI002546F7B9|nr:TOM complex component Tom7 [Penicillium waksmanii]KAJ5966026.1 TOM complex component Tom7 [Penicillium waksmanii]